MRRAVTVALNAWSRKKIPDPVITMRALSIDGQRVFVRTYRVTRDGSGRSLGEGGVPVIVLVHGIGVSARYFIPLANALADVADVLMMDLPGFSTLPVPDKALGIEGFGRTLVETIRAEGIKDPVILGHSMGAQVVVEALNEAPDLAGRILLLGPPVNAAERSLVRVGVRFLQSSALEPFRVGLVAIPAYLQCGMHWFVEVLPAMLGYPVESKIANVSAALVLVRGEHDYVAPPNWIEDLATASGGAAEIYTVAHAAHSVMYEHHDLIAHRLIELAMTASPLGGDVVREEDLRQLARRRHLPEADAHNPHDIVTALLPNDDEIAGRETSSAKVRRRIMGSPLAALAHAGHVLVTDVRDGTRETFRSSQWRETMPGDYWHSLKQEKANLVAAARDALTIMRRGWADEAEIEEFEERLTPYPVYTVSGMAQTWRIFGPLGDKLRAQGVDVRPIETLGRSLAPIDELAARVEARLRHDDVRNAVLVAHSKGGLVAKCVLLGPEGWRVRRVIALGTPWQGSALAGLAPLWGPARQLNPANGEIAKLARHPEVNGRIWTVSASFDEQVPQGTTLEGARDVALEQAGHNHLTDGAEAMAVVSRLLAEDAEGE